MTGSETMQARRAALLLHGLPPAVRQRVVARLSAAESARLQPLLDELAELGVSQSISERLQDVASRLQSTVATTATASTVGALTVLEQVDRLSAEDVARCLRHCSPVTAAQLLRSREWPWRAQALGLMPQARRVFESTPSSSSELAPAVLTALCERLCLDAASANSSRPQVCESSARRGDTEGQTAVRSKFERLTAWIR